jgi:hypothetical protein
MRVRAWHSRVSLTDDRDSREKNRLLRYLRVRGKGWVAAREDAPDVLPFITKYIALLSLTHTFNA